EREVGGQGGALVAALFLDDLNQHDLPTADHFLDLVLAHQPPAAPGDLFLHDVVVVFRPGVAVVVLVVVAILTGGGAGAVAAATLGLVVVVFLLRLFAHQRFAVGDRNLVVVRVDFVEGQEAVAVATVFDERSLQGRLDARHLGQVDVPSKLLSV